MKTTIILILMIFQLLFTLNVQGQIIFPIGNDSTDFGKDITLDKAGNIVITGYFSKTVDFDPGTSIHNLTSNGSTDIFIAKYRPNGDYLWAIEFGSVGEDGSNSVETDNNGNIYVCGFISGLADFDPGPGIVNGLIHGMRDAYVAKYDSGGNLLWVNTIGADSLDEAYDLKVDENGNVYLVGSFEHIIDVDPGPTVVNLISRGGKDVYCIKYNSSGLYVWSFRNGDLYDNEGMAISIRSDGDGFLCGYINNLKEIEPFSVVNNVSMPETNFDIFISKFSVSGSILWSKIIGGSGSDLPSPGSMAIDPLGGFYITGGFSDTVDFDPGFGVTELISNGGTDIFVARYDTNGFYQKCFSFGGTGDDKANRIKVDWDGNIYLTGWFNGVVDFNPEDGEYLIYGKGTNGASDIFLAKYGFLQGNLLWANGFGASISDPLSLSCGSSLELDSLGNCFATGRFFGTCDFDPTLGTQNLTSAGSSDGFVVKYNFSGNIWQNIPEITIAPTLVDFGNVPVNNSTEAGFLVYNTGDGNLTISSTASTNLRFTVTPITTTVLPNKFQQFVVTFTPLTIGSDSGYIVLIHNTGNNRDSVKVIGRGSELQGSISMSITTGWNLISLPVVMTDASKNILFPTATSDAFAYNGTGYFIVDSLQTGFGYWLKFDSMQTVRLTGQPLVVDTVWVTSGWNLIGSITFPVETSSIIQEPSANVNSGYFEYLNSYIEATILVPGRGYWVKVSNDGKLILVAP